MTASSRAPDGDADQARAIASLYRRLICLVGVQLIVGTAVNFIDQQNPSRTEAAIGLAGILFAVVAMGFAVVAAYRLMQHLGAGAPLSWALGMFVPVVNIVVLLMISTKAQEWCRARGIEVGFLGPTKASLDRLGERAGR
jgi:hypothetical protein